MRSSSRRQLSVKTDFGVIFQLSDASTRWWFSKMDYYWMPHLIHFASLADLVYSYTAVEVATVQCTDAVGSSALRCAIVCSVALLLYGCGARCRSVATTLQQLLKPSVRQRAIHACLFVCLCFRFVYSCPHPPRGMPFTVVSTVIVAGRARRRRRSAGDLRRHARAPCALACRDQRALAPSLLTPVRKYATLRAHL